MSIPLGYAMSEQFSQCVSSVFSYPILIKEKVFSTLKGVYNRPYS